MTWSNSGAEALILGRFRGSSHSSSEAIALLTAWIKICTLTQSLFFKTNSVNKMLLRPKLQELRAPHDRQTPGMSAIKRAAPAGG